MVTSLGNFRSDLNIVHIPGGDFLAARDDLFVNINLLRMGCSGRSGLNLDSPKYAYFLASIRPFDEPTISTQLQFEGQVHAIILTH